MEMVTSPYTVALRDCPDVRPRERIAAETRYAHELERLCGGPEGVAAALHTIYSLEDSPPFELTSHEQATARLWSNAALAARQAAYDFLGEPEGAYFEVRPTEIRTILLKIFSLKSRALCLVPILAWTLSGCSASARTPTPIADLWSHVTAQPSSFAKCPQFFANGQPPIGAVKPKQRELCYEAFAILHSGVTRTPVFVAQRLNRRSVEDAGEKRYDKFYADARLPRSERAELDDYKGSGYSRGHMAPAGDMPSPTAMEQSFSLANMVPQNATNNSGPWAKIEQDTRRYALRAKGDIYVITGPVFTKDSPRIGANGVAVPTYLFKLVYDASAGRSWAHWQENRSGESVGRPISYEELVRRTGIDFLPGAASQP